MTPPVPAVVDIPESAINALCRAIAPDENPADWPQDVELARTGLAAAAPHLIADELRAFATRYRNLGKYGVQSPYTRAMHAVADEMFARADELDGGAAR